MSDDPIEVAASCWDTMIAEEMENLRTCSPIHVTIPDVSLPAVTVEGQTAVPDLLPDGSPSQPSLVSRAPVWYPGGGGFFIRYPLTVGDIALGIASDRSLAAWGLTRTPGPQSAPTFPHYHNISDTQILPVTDQPGIDEGDPGLATDFVIGGPAGEAFRVGTPGEVTITKSGATVATITLDAAGAITLTPAAGQSVNVGGDAATALTLWAQLSAAMTSMLNAGAGAVGVSGDPSGENAGAAFAAAQGAWELAISGASPATTTAKGV